MEERERAAKRMENILKSKGYEVSIKKARIVNLIGEVKEELVITASKGENVVRWKATEVHYEIMIRATKDNADKEKWEDKGFIIEEDGEYVRAFKKSKDFRELEEW